MSPVRPTRADHPVRVAVVGGGLSGLVTAYALGRARAGGRAVECTVLESGNRAGGNLVTVRDGSWLIDGGPDSWAAAKPHGAALCHALGLGGDLVGTLAHNRRVYTVRHGRLVRMPDGVMMGVPTDLSAFARSPLVSPMGKLRMALDLVLPARTDGADESLGALVARRMGAEAVDALAAPLLGGIYAGDADRLSARATFPQFVEMEARYGSLVRGALAAKKLRSVATPAPSMFVSLRGGVGSLVDALVAQLPEGTLRLNTPVRSVAALPAGDPSGRWRVTTVSGEEILADHVVLALPAWSAAEALEGTSPEAAGALRAVPYASAATVFFAYRRAEVDHPLDATGFVVPKREGLRILAATWVTSKWAGRAPEGHVLMRAFVGGVGRDGLMQRPDADLVAMASEDLGRLMGLRAAPGFTRVFRFVRTSPQPEVGHTGHVARIRAAEAALPGIHLVSNAYDGVGIPDVIRLAEGVAARVLTA